MQPKIRSRNKSTPSFIEAARRDQLVEAAIATIAEVGYAKASFVRIAERAAISPGLISYHFSTKGELLEQVIVHITTTMDRAMSARAEGASGYVAALRAMIEAFVHYCAGHRPEMLALLQLSSNAEDPEVAKELARTQETGLSELEEMFQKGQEARAFRAFSPRTMAVTLMGALEAVPRELALRPETDVDAYACELATAFELAVQPLPHAPRAKHKKRR
ncbi:TetR/AcrR family transcriptional regulator [Pendulispora albinea]|uniref:TetR family transcriptional regulator n=1 Tax=Pendulispora albinea TaxID=2741071 RepID=A0ABZ2M7Q5_9BACT